MEIPIGKQPYRLWIGLFILWVLVLLSTPTAITFFGNEVIPTMATLSLVTLLLVIFSALSTSWSSKQMIRTTVTVVLLSWTLEVVGVHSGHLFGDYHYTDLLPFHLLGVPLLVPFTWLMMIVPAWGVASMILSEEPGQNSFSFDVKFAALSALILTCWDFYVDPQMVGFGAWVWESPSGYFGTPWLNFVGWWITGFVATLLVRPKRLPGVKMLIVYSTMWLLHGIAISAIWGKPYPALFGFFAMGSFVIVGWLRWKAQSAPAIARSSLQKS